MLDLGGARQVSHHGVLMTLPAAATPESAAWQPPILKTAALEGQGIAKVIAAIEQHKQYLDSSGEHARRQHERLAQELETILRDTLMRRLLGQLAPTDVDAMLAQLTARQIDPYTAAQQLLARAGLASIEHRS
jgi:LAO/AO transport system kinase